MTADMDQVYRKPMSIGRSRFRAPQGRADRQRRAPRHSLYALLDQVFIGRTGYTEDDALELISSVDALEFRRLVHIPSDAELLDAGWPQPLVDQVEPSIRAQMNGFRRIAERRAKGDRAIVKAYNKSKHMLLAMLDSDDHGLVVNLLTSETGCEDTSTGVVLTGAILSTKPEKILERAQGAIQMQAVVNSMLAMILRIRYGEHLDAAPWIRKAADLPGWAED